MTESIESKSWQTRKTLSHHKLAPQKKLGQNFLVNQEVINKVLEEAHPQAEDIVVEIGPGMGALTLPIAQKVKRLVAVEFDHQMVEVLKDKIKEFENIEIINQDILDFHPEQKELPAFKYKLIGAIPYQITSPLLHHLINWKQKPSITVMVVQKEVAEKICAVPPEGSYLSTFLSFYGQATYIKTISAGSFFPVPKVDSAIMTITFGDMPKAPEPKELSKFLHQGFINPRKMINKAFDKELLHKAEIDGQLRPANLTKEQWQKLFELTR